MKQKKSIFVATFQDRLKERRRELEWSQEHLGDLLGMSKANVSRYETGQHDPTINSIHEFAKVLKVQTSWLCGLQTIKNISYDNIPSKTIAIFSSLSIKDKTFNLDKDKILYYDVVPEDSIVDFALISNDNSLESENIFDHDILYIKRTSEYNNGDLVLLKADNYITIKRVYLDDGNITLLPKDSLIKLIYLKKELNRVSIFGKIMSIKRNINL